MDALFQKPQSAGKMRCRELARFGQAFWDAIAVFCLAETVWRTRPARWRWHPRQCGLCGSAKTPMLSESIERLFRRDAEIDA
jgi:hypothetical protein